MLMQDYMNFGLLCLTSFFTLINPLSVIPVFMTMTADLTNQQRTATARKALLVAFFTLVAFALSGQLLFTFFGISVNAFRIVGGVLFFLMGYDMLQARLTRIKVDEESVKKYVGDISVTPLAIPMLCGPGSMTNAIVLMEDATNFGLKAVLFTSIAIVCLLSFLILWSSNRLLKLMGETGNKIMMRLMGLIMMVIAVEFFFSGMKPFLREVLLP